MSFIPLSVYLNCILLPNLWFSWSGFVGKMAVDHLIHELNPNHLADVYSTSFPPQVVIRTDGVADLMKNTIFYSKTTSNNDLLLLTGDSQPADPVSEYLLAEEILQIAAKFDTKKVFTLGAYITGVFLDRGHVYLEQLLMQGFYKHFTNKIS